MQVCFFFFQAEDGIRDIGVTGVQTCALPIYPVDRAYHDHGGERAWRSLPQHGGDPAGRREEHEQAVDDTALLDDAEIVQDDARGGQRGERDEDRPGEAQRADGGAHWTASTRSTGAEAVAVAVAVAV